MRSTSPFISLNDVSLRLHDRVLFEGLNWEILSDQHWAVIGPNGSGKSTLMKALCGSVPIVKGKLVYHFIQNGGQNAAPQDQIAYVTFESQRMVLGDEAFYQARWNSGLDGDTLSVDQYLSECDVKGINPYQVAESHSDEEFAARRQEVIEQLELGMLLSRNVIQLSNGERRKVLIARALLKSPKLIILDNPFAGLDEHLRIKLEENLEALMRGDMRVIIAGTTRDKIPPGITHVLSVEINHVIAQGPRQAISSIAALPQARLDDLPAVTDETHAESEAAHPILIHLDNVSVSYNGTKVLRQVSWTVRENERWALLGPNGAGKTTLLSLIIADNPQAYANDITLFGRRRGSGESIWEIKQAIGWVAPELHLYYPRGTTCLDVVCSGWFDSVGLYRRCSPDQRETAVAWMRRLGISDGAERAFDKISEGEQRLALMARALVKSPPLLVLDEPCQGLDAGNRDRVLQAIDSIAGRPATSMIYVTHRTDELPHSITHVLKLDEGRVVGQIRMRN